MKTQMIFTGVLGQRRSALRSSAWQMYTAIAVCVATCVVAGGNVSHGQGFPVQTASGVQGGLFKHQGSDFRVVNTAGFRTAADLGATEPGSVAQVAHGHSINQSCGSCGTSCGGSCGRISDLSCSPKFTNPCQPCTPYRYGMIEALYMAPDDIGFSPTPGFGLPDFEYEFGSRITIGVVGDCVNGYEASFTGPFDWDVNNVQPGTVLLDRVIATAPVNSIVGGATQADLSNILQESSVSAQSQSLSAEYFSAELSRTLNSSEFIKFLYGGRYVRYAEDYDYSGIFENDLTTDPLPAGLPTQNTLTTTNLGLSNDIENNLIGGQVGLDLLFPISRHAFTDLRLRAGVYANFVEADFDVTGSTTVASTPGAFTDATTPLTSSNNDDDIELAGIFEISSGIRYQVGEILALRAGVELWYLSGIASATNNVGVGINGANRPNLNADDDILFTGLSVGAELRY